MFLQLCCKVQFKDPQVLRYKCNIAVRYLKPGYALVQHTGLWCTVRQDQKQHKRSSSSVSEIGSLQCKTLHGSWFTITELVNMEVDGHRLKKARDQAHYRCKNQTLAVRSLAQTAHCTWISWSDSRERCPYSLLCTHRPSCLSNSRLTDSRQTERWSSPSCLSRTLTRSATWTENMWKWLERVQMRLAADVQRKQ